MKIKTRRIIQKVKYTVLGILLMMLYIYICSTCQSLSQRMALHRYDSIKPTRQNTKIYNLMTEYGRDKFYIDLIEDYPCENIYQLQRKEGELIRDIKPSLNIVVAGRTTEEYKKEEKEKIRISKSKSATKYRELNAERIKQKKREYYEQNIEMIKEKNKEYRELNAETLKQKQKEFYMKNVEKYTEYHKLNAEKIKQRKKEYYYRKKAEKNNF